jgi:hypothetical protein
MDVASGSFGIIESIAKLSQYMEGSPSLETMKER